VPSNWKKLEENVFGEFGLHEVLKQFLGEGRAAKLSPAWAGDRYEVFEDTKTKNTLLVFRLVLRSTDDAAIFFGNYSEALELKYKARTELYRRPNYFQFEAPEGGVFLHCVADECLAVEGTTRAVFDKINSALRWPAAPAPIKSVPAKTTAVALVLP
jgi:hypothetical protein